MVNKPSNLGLALQIAARGWAVFPCREEYGEAYTTKTGEKKTPKPKDPYTRHGFHDATTNAEQITAWWEAHHGALVGIPCAPNGFFAVDIDTKGGVDGLAEWQRLIEAYGGGQAPSVGQYQNTPSGGAHLLFSLPDGVKIPTNAGKLAPGVDLRAAGYICTGVLPDGRGYTWTPELGYTKPVLDPPTWLIERIAAMRAPALPARGEQSAALTSTGDGERWLAAALAKAHPGNRNATGFELACQLRDDRLTQAQAEGVLLAYAARVPGDGYTDGEALASLDSAYKLPPREPARSNGNGHHPHPAGDWMPEAPEPPAGWDMPEPGDLAKVHPQAGEGAHLVGDARKGGAHLVGEARYIVHTAGEALQPQPPIDYVVGGLFEAGSLSMVFGEAGSKKTYAMIDLAVCQAMGEDWLGYETYGLPTLIVDEESGNARMMRRLGDTMRGHGAKGDLPIFTVSYAGFNLRTEDDQQELHRLILQTGARLIIVDALADIMPGADENTVKDVQPVCSALRRVADKTRAAIVLIHHANKAGSYRGSSALKGAVDMMLEVQSKSESPNIDFTTEKSRDGIPPKFSAVATWLENFFRLDASERINTEKTLSKSQVYVMDFLYRNGPSTKKDIESHADLCSANAARQALYSLVSEGFAYRTDSGGQGAEATFDLTPKGKARKESKGV